MDQFILIACIALAVGGLVWGATALMLRLSKPEKRKLQQRLASDGTLGPQTASNRPLLLQAQPTGLPQFLSRTAIIQGLQQWLTQASPTATAGRFLMTEAGFSFLPSALVMLITFNPIMGLIAGLAGAVLPYLVVSTRRSGRIKTFCLQLPEALDFLSRVLRSGQSLSTGLQMMSQELPQPLAAEFGRCYDQHSLGQSIEDGLRDMTRRIGSTDFAFFATAVIIQRQTGGDLAEVLHNISDMIRKRVRLAQSVKAKTAEGRFTGYIMLAFPAVMFGLTYFIDPVRGDVLLKTSTGHILIGVAAGLEIFGLFLIKRITTIKI